MCPASEGGRAGSTAETILPRSLCVDTDMLRSVEPPDADTPAHQGMAPGGHVPRSHASAVVFTPSSGVP